MKKKYTQKVIQYDIEGNKIKEYINVSSIPTSISNRDSIIRCCKGKYKVAGGYVFRFKGDDFNKYKEDKDKIEHICKICSKGQTIRGMAMHLKFHHKLKTNNYVEKYGEFRPKKLKNIKKQNKSKIKCEICNKKLNSNQHLMYHITKDHPNITQSEYIIKYKYNNQAPLCKCGCGEEVTLLRNGKNLDLNKDIYNRDYIKGHWDWEVFSNINHQSKEELEILDYIKSFYKGEIKTSYRFIKNSEIDIYFPELNIGIEYNGLYWHCEKNGRGRKYHIEKTLKAKENSIRLIQIFSDEWYNSKEIVKSKLKNILGYQTKRLYARKCKIKETSKLLKNEFLDKYHIQGKDRSSISLGIYYKDELKGIMTFSRPRVALGGKDKKDNTWELSRYAASCSIIGGASKLVKYFERNYKVNQIYSYSDNRWTDWKNNMYLSIGFKLDSISSPGYWYTKNFTERKHRFNFTKNSLIKKGMGVKEQTEKEIMESHNYYRIWDCGSAKYIKYLI